MAGHSKWANIQHRKGAQDAKRGKLFTRFIREITIAARSGLPDPAANPRLRLAVDKALGANMSKDTIERAIKRGAGADDGSTLEEIRYEGYGPGGIAVMVDCMTDNRNRTVAEVRHAFSKCGGNLGTSGSVAFQFTETGVISYPAGTDQEKVMEVALEAGADDLVENEDGSFDVLTAPDAFAAVREALDGAGLVAESAEVTMRAGNTVALGLDDARSMIKLLDMLEDLDDTQNVYSNADIPEAVMAQL
ncbi:MAG TPA: YebC/PmpR family DNA-binding transcriptional regulator [Plasticicumulans sp.]|uniref:YebC/PmpR family DNA-binding transcriptional regulator n=1 Tax=Plasticicumulans sp. TaxID=2307179 RepID=UPI002BDE0BAB|nr:YebC/PmpR family DNA-binding transcriptional regulator [Plasticicumulans sp.]MBS0600501.1 YebC/PmpR family DNA-binding transcriptional regulator [Pseudomonadota bacterium]HMV39788.1 YebC/PmpR family DNA-binding transcriptional regulator [Plasticicumulans sp.]HMW28738.1 YebC/PmpR family DNA-binding transcriptional regulator [Plasticicumulans sp.]HMW41063.1 YebC/PmpR family DNA-binding transcriptional regulator [Plasticicumulans sp.]HMX53398.1 YebC/PmpR family DNA-binding transcriptional regu